MKKSVIYEIFLRMAKYCPHGTSLYNAHEKMDRCTNCPNQSFNLKEGDYCHKCPPNFVCTATNIYLPKGMWRLSQMSYEFK